MSRVTMTRTASLLATVALAATGLASGGTGAQAAASIGTITPMLEQPAGLVSDTPPSTADCQAALHISCYSPRQVQAAYNLSAVYARKITGRGQTIVIVDAYGSPTLGRDLSTFDKTYRLPPPPSLKIITPVGKPPAFTRTTRRLSWAGETTLDVEYAHAMAPGAKILVVVLPTDGGGIGSADPTVAAEQYVINHHLGSIISQSFGQGETSLPKSVLLGRRSAFVSAVAHHVTVLASSGDQGATVVNHSGTYNSSRMVSWPASDPLVTAVGGTRLNLDAAGNRMTADVAWNDTTSAAVQSFFSEPKKITPLATGGGKSVVFGRPSFQKAVSPVVRASRGLPDIAMSGACDGSVLVYQSFNGAHWSPTCGTSEAAPLFAGIVALANQAAGHPLGALNNKLYALYAAHAPGLVDVTAGNTTVSFIQSGKKHTVLGTSAHKGYDMASGVGTIDAGKLVFELAGKG